MVLKMVCQLFCSLLAGPNFRTFVGKASGYDCEDFELSFGGSCWHDLAKELAAGNRPEALTPIESCLARPLCSAFSALRGRALIHPFGPTLPQRPTGAAEEESPLRTFPFWSGEGYSLMTIFPRASPRPVRDSASGTDESGSTASICGVI